MKKEIPSDPVEQVGYYKDQIAQEKAGKRKLFHSMVKLANELRKMRETSEQVEEERQFLERNWYEGGLWRAPSVLPTVSSANPLRTARLTAISLSDLFFNLVIVTAFTSPSAVSASASGRNTSKLICGRRFPKALRSSSSKTT